MNELNDGGYQPIYGYLDSLKPPQGGSGVYSKSPKYGIPPLLKYFKHYKTYLLYKKLMRDILNE